MTLVECFVSNWVTSIFIPKVGATSFTSTREKVLAVFGPIILAPHNPSSENLGRIIATALVSITGAGNTP
ncbi:MAG: hypothetical protein MUW57_25305 [Pseudomonas sp.]|nr:hypothetical protein [Pseudomonas sp.]